MTQYTITVREGGDYSTDKLAEATVHLPDSLDGTDLDEFVAANAAIVVGAFVDAFGDVVKKVANRRDRRETTDALRAIVAGGREAMERASAEDPLGARQRRLDADAPWPAHLEVKPTGEDETDATVAPDFQDLLADPDFVRDEAEANPA